MFIINKEWRTRVGIPVKGGHVQQLVEEYLRPHLRELLDVRWGAVGEPHAVHPLRHHHASR
eukprot:7780316-Pyramimonas_sp.AAC.1